LNTKQLHSTDSVNFLQNIAYAYNERGWVTTMNSSLLGQSLLYTNPQVGAAQYNGNITEYVYTKTGVGIETVLYSYDKLNRLTYSGSSDALGETESYDPMGNISSLTRLGTFAATLAYTYTNGNQLASVTNSGAAYRSYSYDGNGNALSDGGLSTAAKNIGYNMLNLPQSVTQNGTTLATYTYDAGGNKLRNNGTDGYWDYDAGIVYNGTTASNGTIQFIQTEEGRVVPQGTGWHYEYNLKDHLGNVRISFDTDPSSGAARRIQEDEYYAFGLRSPFYNYSNNNRYLYNGKEVQTDLASQYDYGARFYDPVIARWNTIDPLIEKDHFAWTPYAYVYNNTMRFTDPDGRDSTQRAAAVAKGKEYVADKKDGNQYKMGAKGQPGEKIDCSGLGSACVVAGGEKDPNHGDGGSGVVNTENNTTKVDEKDVQAGNMVTFRHTGGYPYHEGIVSEVVKDKDGNIVTIKYIQSSGGVGPNENSFNVADGGPSESTQVHGYYKWDTKPDGPKLPAIAPMAQPKMQQDATKVVNPIVKPIVTSNQ